MDSVTQYIQGELLGRRAICLPYIGTLAVVRHSAQMSHSGGDMLPPYDMLELDSKSFDEARSLPTLLGSVEAYNEWYYSCQDVSGRVLYLSDVCSINLENFNVAIAEPFAELLHPTSMADESVAIGRSRGQANSKNEVARAVKRRTRKNNKSNIALTLSLALVVLALMYILYASFLSNG